MKRWTTTSDAGPILPLLERNFLSLKPGASYPVKPGRATKAILLVGWLVCTLVSPKAKAQAFRDISANIGINTYCLDRHDMGGGVVFFDYNQDNYPDLFIIGGEAPCALYRNNWDGSFSNVSKTAGLDLADFTTVGAAVGDIDNDGDQDVLVTTSRDFANVLLENNGDGTFTDISEEAGIKELAWSTSASFGDFNLDGLIDIYVSNYAMYQGEPFSQNIRGGYSNFLYQNMGNNQFVNVANGLGVADIGCGLATAFTDSDNDHDADIYVANDFGLSFEPNELYINQYPQNNFDPIASFAGVKVKINAMGIAIGDYDEDGDFDYYVTNIADNPFFENTQSGSLFNDIGIEKGISNPDGTSWGTAFLDYNNDSYLDLVVANGQVIEASHQNDENRLFQGGKEHQFEDVSKTVGIASPKRCRGLSFADMDNDGDLDVLFGVVDANEQAEENALLYQNITANKNNWFKVKLQGTHNNRNGYGSRVRVVIGDRSLIREADGGSSYLSHSFNVIHFGLGNSSTVDSLIVTWPGGHQDIYTHLKANAAVTVVEDSHAYPYRNEAISIFSGDSIFLAGAFRKEEGIYHHFLSDENAVDTALIITKLTLLERPIPSSKEVGFTAFPNPFQHSMQLKYHLHEKSRVRLTVFDLQGKQLKVLLEENQAAGTHYFPYEGLPSTYANGLLVFRLSIDDQNYVLKAVKFQ